MSQRVSFSLYDHHDVGSVLSAQSRNGTPPGRSQATHNCMCSEGGVVLWPVLHAEDEGTTGP
eukprot:1143487-Pelagomonas_calceolata.AAC.3